MTYIVALTGGIGSGKTTVSNSFKKLGINIIDTDIIAKNIIKYNFQVSESIKKKFGNKIININNSINRFLLRKYIFNNKNHRLWLENLLYPKIFQETKNEIKLIKSTWCLWVVPLLFEKKLEKKANRILLVDSPIKYQIKRVVERDKISLQEAKKIISLQATRRERRSMSDDIIFNKNKIKKTYQCIYYLNYFYSYLGYKYHQNKTKNINKNYLTKFY
ncbi:dephospho-CoA kinase [Buchnera aphidicola]|uniref:Dephospho-CoA kinase n=1 Tax=Buchnera aphidicola str. USDA (Myzus persicae) TaxID=1009856 RepID=W0P486_BUCMP|nr:dephospho-CoA kinase [Buchnera aphidicola]AHG60170.1 Coae [Buchnera aphidicola str. USDA (Myzus persicae)]AHG60749.1 Coae [Buchnera aphidicola str. W106 (Myzus persicae)]AHG61322.1 Coae [Buchnera aphidicola str. G002 (Myzus persicae)]AHG61895.1 Coae [Buchnera aphidicola str. F009 (Myzus persicae)]WAI03139.1 MAG: dephospho-CoA kinase [Buchnera aphidicola (Myzus persicae)]